MTEITVPQLNANEDEVLLSGILVQEGEHVHAGAPLCVVETTKATFEIEAPAAGGVRGLKPTVDQRLRGGARFCALPDPPDEPIAPAASPQAGPSRSDGSDRITSRALQ